MNANMLSNKFSECHVFILPSQGGIYTMCRLPSSSKTNPVRILAASLKRPVYLLEFYHDAKKSLAPRSTELTFTYIQGQAEIISIDALLKPLTSSVLIGVTYIKNISGDSGKYLNIYTLREPGSEAAMDALAFSCSLELNYIPYQLFHGIADEKSHFFLSGSDYKIRAYREDLSRHVAKECTVSKTFPEFSHEFPSVILCTAFHHTEDGHRLTAVGCECGAIYLFLVNTKTNSTISRHETDLGCSVSSLKFFLVNGLVQLLVTLSVLPAVIYRNTVDTGFKDFEVLLGSDEFDVVTCSLVADIHMDRKLTILLGTYGQELLAYRFEDLGWMKKWQKSFSHPILALDYCDMTGDGVKELVAMTTRGVHVFQHDLEEVAQLLISRQRTKEMLNC